MASGNDAEERTYTSQASVISGWIRDHRFTDSRGRPTPLAFNQGHPTFIDLVETFGMGATPQALLDDLIQVGTVILSKDGRITLMHRR